MRLSLGTRLGAYERIGSAGSPLRLTNDPGDDLMLVENFR